MSRLALVVAVLSLVTGCAGGSNAPSAPPANGLAVTPASLSFNGTGQTQSVAVVDAVASTFSVTGCAGVATTGGVVSGALSVTSVAVGTCTLTISDAFGRAVPLAITVSSVAIPIQ